MHVAGQRSRLSRSIRVAPIPKYLEEWTPAMSDEPRIPSSDMAWEMIFIVFGSSRLSSAPRVLLTISCFRAITLLMLRKSASSLAERDSVFRAEVIESKNLTHMSINSLMSRMFVSSC